MEASGTLLQTVAELLRLVSAAGLAVFAGAMLTEGFVLVPYWRSLAASDFFAWYAANDRRLLGFFGPVTGVAALLAVVAAAVSLWTGDAGRWWTVLAAALLLIAVAMFPLYFEGANASFAAASVGEARLPAELARWARWHDVRTALALGAVVAALVGVRGTA